ncbi:MAG: 50S ribosomal protein L5, partial [Actinobacteria bacterium]|nr:50S ribosomal protein L5 [Actinomycetota bacterium]
MATKTATKTAKKASEAAAAPRLKTAYEALRPQLREQLGLDSIMQVPRLQKITLNMGVGEAKTD